MKKMFSLALALIMALALTVPALAATDNTPKTITIANSEDGQTYTAYKIFDVTISGENYAYTIDSDSQFWDTIIDFMDGENNVLTTNEPALKVGNGLTLSESSEAANSGAAGEYKWNVIGDSLNAVALAEHLNAAILATKATVATDDDFENAGSVAATGANAVINVTGAGYYFVDSSMGALCALDTADTVTVYEKNSKPSIQKKVQEDSNKNWGDSADADFNDIVKFELTVNTGTEDAYEGNTDDTANLGTGVDDDYVIVDALPAGMTYQDDIVVKVGSDTWTLDTDYTVDSTTVADQITITLLKTGALKDLAQNTNIIITYSASLDNDAVVDGNGNINTVTLTYHGETSTDTATVYTYAFDLVKTDVDNAVITGAEFKLYASKTVDNDEVIDETAEIGVIYDAALGAYRKVVDGETATVITAGNVVVSGLDSDTYFLVETKAPAGYNMLTAPVEVVIEGDNLEATVTDDVWTAGGVHVINNSGTELPSTGGMGTTIFYVIGGVLMAGAAVLLVTKKKLANEQ